MGGSPLTVDPAAPAGPRTARLRRLRGLYLPVALLAAWQFVWRFQLLDPNLVPSPASVVAAWWTWTFGPRSSVAWYSGTWLPYLLMSAWRVLVGFAIAGAVGVLLGMLIGWYKLVAELLEPFLQSLRPIPITAWLPFATLIFGIREGSAISLIVLGAFFPVLVNTVAGARMTPGVLIRAARMLGARPHRLLTRVVLPSALPNIVTGLRLGLGIAWVLVIVSEMLAVKGGLGYALWTAYQFARMDLIICAMVTVGLLGLISDELLLWAARPLLRWTKGI